MAIKAHNTISQNDYVKMVHERRAEVLLSEFYAEVREDAEGLTHLENTERWESRGMVVACSGETENVKKLIKDHLRDNGWDAHIVRVVDGLAVKNTDMPSRHETHVVVFRPQGL